MENNETRKKSDDIIFYIFISTIIFGFIGGLAFIVVSLFTN